MLGTGSSPGLHPNTAQAASSHATGQASSTQDSIQSRPECLQFQGSWRLVQAASFWALLHCGLVFLGYSFDTSSCKLQLTVAARGSSAWRDVKEAGVPRIQTICRQVSGRQRGRNVIGGKG